MEGGSRGFLIAETGKTGAAIHSRQPHCFGLVFTFVKEGIVKKNKRKSTGFGPVGQSTVLAKLSFRGQILLGTPVSATACMSLMLGEN